MLGDFEIGVAAEAIEFDFTLGYAAYARSDVCVMATLDWVVVIVVIVVAIVGLFLLEFSQRKR